MTHVVICICQFSLLYLVPMLWQSNCAKTTPISSCCDSRPHGAARANESTRSSTPGCSLCPRTSSFTNWTSTKTRKCTVFLNPNDG